MAGIYGALNVGKQALLVQQQALNVAAHNIANANTPGYTRQRLITETTTPVRTSFGQLGTGVRVSETERVYDRYVTTQISDETETLGKWEATKEGLERVEVVFNEATGIGLQNSMSTFWNAWQDLTNNPSGHTEREMLVGAAGNMAYDFQQAYNDLEDIQQELDTNISQTVDQINAKADQIAELNAKIVQIEANGDTANDYRDSRERLVKEMSEMIDLTASEQDSGSVTITLGDGNKIVEGSTASDLSTHTNTSGLSDVVWADDEDDPPASINDDISGGKLKGWLDVRDTTVPGYLEDMENLVNSIKGVETTKVTANAAKTLSGGESFTLSSPSTDYYVWYDIKGGAGADPTPGGTGIVVDIASEDTAAEVATKTAKAIAAKGGGAVFDVPTPTGSILTISNAVAGAATDTADNDTGFAIAKLTDGGNGVNTLHRSGYGLDGVNDRDFFSGTLEGNDFGVASAVSENVNKIAAASDTDGDPGDNRNAIAIADLQYSLTMSGDTATFGDYYNSMVSDVGFDVQEATSSYKHQDAMLSQLENYRESISGVSLDEEMINMLEFESAYKSAAKLISKVDEMLQTLMNII